MKDKEKRLRKLQFRHTPKSDPTSPAAGTSKDPPPHLDLTRVLSGSFTASPRRKRSPSPSRFTLDTVESIFKPRINRTASAGSTKQRFRVDEQNSGLISSTNAPAGAGTPVGQMANSPTTGSPGPLSAKASRTSTNTAAPLPFQPPKSKFKMAHESFRIRMFQEQYGFEPVFMTKKRTADSKFSEFKGGDLNKYTARSYTIKNGNEVFGVRFFNEPSYPPGMVLERPTIRVEKFRHYPTKYYDVYNGYDEGKSFLGD